MDDLERARRRRRESDADFDTPNCPSCLLRMTPTAYDIGAAWECNECGRILLPGER
jgi:predicted RNA-binding Zn-ribbon protein involved in translation (DUF1610 family)